MNSDAEQRDESLRLIDELSRSDRYLGAVNGAPGAGEPEGSAGVGNWELVPETGELSVSPGFARLLGLGADEPLDWRGLTALVDGEDAEVVLGASATCLATGSSTCEVRARRGDGQLRTIAVQAEAVSARDGRVRRVRGTILDVTAEREAERERADVASLFRLGFDASPIGLALTDPETGAYIRVNDALCRLLDRSREQLTALTAGAVTHPGDRDGDREFRQEMVDGLISSVQYEKRYLRPDGELVWSTLSASLVRRADGSPLAVFSQVLDITELKEHEARFEQDVNDAVWLGRIRAALDEDRLVLYRQPIVNLRTGETIQHELLLRMLGEDGTIIAPGDFLPIAERYGLISEIDRWVIGRAVDQAAQGRATEFNLSAASVGDPGILRELASAIQRTGADPSLLVVEVTETAMMNHLDAGRVFAEGVTALGCGLALDDFGTGYASLSYLKRIPAQHLKIDIEFVRDLVTSKTDERLVRGIIGIAREFDQTTIAEGIEDRATLVRLREIGVDFGQGFLFGRPAPVDDAAPAITAATAGPAAGQAATGGEGPLPPLDADPLGLVRAAFAAFAGRDLDRMSELCWPDVVVRAQTTSQRAGRQAPYQGRDGLQAYARDVAAVWKSLTLTPTAFRLAGASVIVFGRVDAASETETFIVDVLWIWELRDGLIASVEVFDTPRRAHPGGRRRGVRVKRRTSRRSPGEAREGSA